MKWRKSPPALIEAFDAALPSDPQAERRQMFGYPCAFVHGHMFAGLHQENLIVRLDERGRAELLLVPGAETFEPLPGRVMREYVVVPPRIVGNGFALREWLERAFAFGITLPIKGPKRRQKAAPAAPPPPRPAVGKAVAKKGAAKKAPTKKAPIKKTPTKKAPVKKAPVKKTAQRR